MVFGFEERGAVATSSAEEAPMVWEVEDLKMVMEKRWVGGRLSLIQAGGRGWLVDLEANGVGLVWFGLDYCAPGSRETSAVCSCACHVSD